MEVGIIKAGRKVAGRKVETYYFVSLPCCELFGLFLNRSGFKEQTPGSVLNFSCPLFLVFQEAAFMLKAFHLVER